MNLISVTHNWLRIVKLGVSVLPKDEDTINTFMVAKVTLFGKRLSLHWF
jgi:hypothetical protein